jgi:hypothetical protein
MSWLYLLICRPIPAPDLTVGVKQFTLNTSVKTVLFQSSRAQSVLSLHQRRRSFALSLLMPGFLPS